MKKFPFELIVILGTILIFFYQFLFLGRLPIPSDTITGLYHPFRDVYAPEYPRGMPFKNFLITDPVRQLYPWRDLAIESIKKAELPIWNPYSFTGSPLLANFQTAAFYPLNILFFIFPFSFTWSLLILLQPLLGGIFLYLFLRNRSLSKSASLLSAVTFMFSGFSVAWLEWNTLMQVIIWLPLILLAKEKLLQKLTFKWTLVLIFAECSAILAGHLQILLYLWTISISYLFLRILNISWRKNDYKETLSLMFKKTLPFIPMVIFILAISAIQWLPTYQFIKESAREIDQINWQKEGWFIPVQHLLQFIVPDFFGNPTTLNYWGTWNYAELVGYVGIAPLILAFFALFFRRDKKTLYFGTIFLLSLFFSLPTFLAKLPFQLHIPLLSSAQPTRLLFLTDFTLAILAGLGADYLLKSKKGLILPLFLIGSLLTALWVLVLTKAEVSEQFITNLTVVRSNLLLPSAIFLITAIIMSFIIFSKRKNMVVIGIYIIIGITFFDLFRFGQKFLPFTNPEYLYPRTKITEYLQRQNGQFRIMTTNREIMPPNFSTMYHIQTIDGYDPLYLRRYGELIAMMESNKGRVPGVLTFNRIITPHNYNSPLINVLNVKYVLSFAEINDKNFKKVLQEGRTILYENTDVLERTYFVTSVISTNSKQEAAEKLFASDFDPQTQAVVETEEPFKETFQNGTARIVSYTPNTIRIETENDSTGFLVLSDAYFPTWKATIVKENGEILDVKIQRTNYNFRGVIVPPGKNTVVFKAELL